MLYGYRTGTESPCLGFDLAVLLTEGTKGGISCFGTGDGRGKKVDNE